MPETKPWSGESGRLSCPLRQSSRKEEYSEEDMPKDRKMPLTHSGRLPDLP